MSKYEFMKLVEESIKTKDEAAGCEVCGRTYIKNNDILRYGISIRKGREKISPTFYVDRYYEDYSRKKITVDEIAKEIVKQLKSIKKREFDCDFDSGIENYGSGITYRLISAQKNKKLLSETPHIPFLDMAMVFAIVFNNTDAGVETVRINNSLMESWDISTKELYDLAKSNTPRLFPYRIESLASVMKKCFDDEIFDDCMCNPDIFILTNSQGVYGATTILYPGMTEKITSLVGGSYYVIPSSVHEILIMPDAGDSFSEELNDTIKLINNEHVLDEEVLSDRAYFYEEKEKRFKI